jgi:hypothetical protein
MAFPTVISNTHLTAAAGTTYTFTMPAGGSAGDLYLVLGDIDGTRTLASTSTGWTLLFDRGAGLGGMSQFGWAGIVGTAASNLVITGGQSGINGDAQVFIISGWAGTIASISSLSVVSTAGVAPQSPALTPAGGAKDYLWIVCASTTASTNEPTGAPTSYANFVSTANGSGTSVGSIVTARRTANTATETPASWVGAAGAFQASTVAIPPTSSALNIAVGLATQVATSAFAITRLKTVPMAVAIQVSTSAFSITRLKTRLVGAASVALTAYPIAFVKGLAPIQVGTAAVTTTAYAITRVKTRLVGAASVAVTAYPITRLKTLVLGSPSVALTAYPITRLKTRLLGAASVAVTAYPLTRAKAVPLGSASVTTTAHAIHFAKDSAIPLGSASVTTTAYPIGFHKTFRVWDLTKWFTSRTAPSNKWSEKLR